MSEKKLIELHLHLDGSLKHHQRQREPLQVLLQGLAVLGDLHFKLYVLGRGSRNGDPLLLR